MLVDENLRVANDHLHRRIAELEEENRHLRVYQGLYQLAANQRDEYADALKGLLDEADLQS